MKKLLFLAAFFAAFSANAQSTYISTNGDVILVSGAIEKYHVPDIICDPRFNTLTQEWIVVLRIAPSGGATAGDGYVKTTEYNYTKAAIDAYTASGSTESDKIMNCILQAVAASLLVLNGSITFTLH
jgi:hypothetical protein